MSQPACKDVSNLLNCGDVGIVHVQEVVLAEIADDADVCRVLGLKSGV